MKRLQIPKEERMNCRSSWTKSMKMEVNKKEIRKKNQYASSNVNLRVGMRVRHTNLETIESSAKLDGGGNLPSSEASRRNNVRGIRAL